MSDYISRQAAIDFINAGYLVNPNEPRWSDNEVVNFLKSRPSVDAVEVRHGHWEECEVLDKNCVEVCQSAKCSICGRYHTTPYMYYFDQYKYCPNCGARMDGEA